MSSASVDRAPLTWLAPVAGLAMVLSCGSTTGQASDAPRHQAPATVEARADAITTATWGTAEQRAAEDYLVFLDVNRLVVDCMQEAGHTLAVPPPYPDYVPNGTGSSGWMGKLDWGPTRRAAEAGNQRKDEPSEPPSAAYRQTLEVCVSEGGDDDDLDVHVGNPVGADEVDAEWDTLIHGISDELGPIDDYDTCMEDKGIGLNGESGADALFMYLEGTPAGSDREVDALEADRTCREDEYLRGLTILEDRLDDFESDHADALAAARAGWQRILDEAIVAGFRP